MHPDHFGCLDQIENSTVAPDAAIEIGGTNENDRNSVGGRGMSAGQVWTGRVIAAHGVDCYREHVEIRTNQLTSMT